MTEHLDVLALEAYVEGQVSFEQRQRAEAHLADCPACRARVARHEPLTALAVRLPVEPAPPELAARIVRALAARQHSRGAGPLTLACVLLGLALVLVSLPEVAASLSDVLRAFGASDLTPLVSGFVATPVETFVAWLEAGMTWHASLTESVGAAFLLGVVLLAAAAFGGLVQMLRAASPQRFSN